MGTVAGHRGWRRQIWGVVGACTAPRALDLLCWVYISLLWALFGGSGSAQAHRRYYEHARQQRVMGLRDSINQSRSNQQRELLMHSLCAEFLVGGGSVPLSSTAMGLVSVDDAEGMVLFDMTLKEMGFSGSVSFEQLVQRSQDRDRRGHLQTHELRSMRDYAALRHRENGETIVFIPFLKGLSVSGFDGVVLNEHREPLANLSVKTILKDAEIEDLIVEGIGKASEFSEFPSWLRPVNFFSLSSSEKVEEAIAWLDDVKEIFLPLHSQQGTRVYAEPRRPIRIVIDVRNKERASEIRAQFARRYAFRRVLDAFVTYQGRPAPIEPVEVLNRGEVMGRISPR